MTVRRIKLSMHRDHALQATRVSVGKAKLVYILTADKKFNYELGKSRIAYIVYINPGTLAGSRVRVELVAPS